MRFLFPECMGPTGMLSTAHDSPAGPGRASEAFCPAPLSSSCQLISFPVLLVVIRHDSSKLATVSILPIWENLFLVLAYFWLRGAET